MMSKRRFNGVVAGAVVIAGLWSPLAAQGDKAKGEKIYADLKCSVCHTIGAAKKKMGPDLAKVGATRDKAWLAKYLPDPKGENAKNKMPAAKAKGADLDHLIAYLLSLK
jgi:cytochrome c2